MDNSKLQILWVTLWLFVVTPQGVAADIPQHDRVRVLVNPRLIPDFELIDRRGEKFQLRNLAGAPAMVFFGFTNCPDVCPMAMSKLKRFQNAAAGSLDEVAIVLISVDGQRDTPERMDAFLGRYSDDFIGLTGDAGVVKLIAKEFSAAFFKVASGDDDQDYSVSHSPQVFLLDSKGRLRAEFYDATVDAMVDVASAVKDESAVE